MSILPNFEIGLWNAWIFTLYHQLLCLVLLGSKGLLVKSSAAAPHGNKRRRTVLLLGILYYIALLYSFFLPLKIGTVWFYAGLPIAILGVILYTAVTVNFATTPTNEPVTKGLYRYSRNPQYISEWLIFIGIGIATASWVFILFSAIYEATLLRFTSSEERFCLEKYGDAYRKYMKRTSKFIGLPKKQSEI